MQTTLKDFRRLTAWPLLLAISLLAAPVTGFAQLMQADDYFHEGAQNYIFGEKDKAVKAIGDGLQAYPQDPKLNGVARLLMKKDQDQKQNQSKKNKNQDQQKQDKQDQQKNSQNQNQQQQQQQAQNDRQKKDDQKKQQQQAKQDQQKKDQEAQADKSDKRDKSGETNGQSTMMMAQMTPQEARQLLDAQRDDEKALIFQPTNMPSPPPNVTMKDW